MSNTASFPLSGRSQDGSGRLAVILNLTPELRLGYRVGLPQAGCWREVMNTDAQIYGGSNQGNLGGVIAEAATPPSPALLRRRHPPPLSVLALRAVPS